jgi:hypothetical protein
VQPDPTDPRVPSRPLWGLAILALPLVGLVIVALGYTALFLVGLQAEALPAEADRFGFSLHLPTDPLAAASLASTLSSPGQLELLAGAQVLADHTDLLDASVRMDLLTQPSLRLALDEDASQRVREQVAQDAEGELTLRIDQVTVASQANKRAVHDDGIDLIPSREGKSERERWAAVASWAVTVDHPLPCAVTLQEGGRAAATGEAPAPASPTR